MPQFQPQERAKAIAEGKAKYFTGRPCKFGHVAERYVSNGCCLECAPAKHNKWKAENPDKMHEATLKSYAKHAEKRRESARKYREANPDKVKQAQKRTTPERKAKHAMNESLRQRKLKHATPKWLTDAHKQWIKDIYIASAKIEGDTAVDHIVPLQGKNVCGLHVPWNLRVTSKVYNSKKHNNFDDMPEYQSAFTVMINQSAMPWNIGK